MQRRERGQAFRPTMDHADCCVSGSALHWHCTGAGRPACAAGGGAGARTRHGHGRGARLAHAGSGHTFVACHAPNTRLHSRSTQATGGPHARTLSLLQWPALHDRPSRVAHPARTSQRSNCAPRSHLARHNAHKPRSLSRTPPRSHTRARPLVTAPPRASAPSYAGLARPTSAPAAGCRRASARRRRRSSSGADARACP